MNASNPNGIIMGGNADSARPLLALSGMHWILRCCDAPSNIESIRTAGERTLFQIKYVRESGNPVDNLAPRLV
jgi:hypothetical protein